MSTTHDSLAAALAAFQAELPDVRKGETATVRSDKGSYSYRYADLAAVTKAVLPALAKHGLSFTARPTVEDGQFVLAYTLRHTTGDRESGSYPLPTSGTPQSIGSAITYARRYCLCAVTGLAPEGDDDDAAAARHAHTETSRPARADNGAHSAPAGPQDDIRKRIIDLGKTRDVFVISDFKKRYNVEFGKASQAQLEEYAGLLSGDGVPV